MKVTALGVTGAFSAGKPINDNISKEKLIEEILSLNNPSREDLLELIINSKTKKLFEPQWQSNFSIEFDQPSIRDGKSPYRLLFDIGSDAKNSLAYQNMNFSMFDGGVITHCHNDHIGGIEGFGLSTFFNPFYSKQKIDWFSGKNVIDKILEIGIENMYRMPDGMKPEIYGHKDVLDDLWKSSKQGFSTLQGVMEPNFEIFFTKKTLTVNGKSMHFIDGNKTWDGLIIKSTHVLAGDRFMPSYGVMFVSSKGEKIFFPSDTKIMSESEIDNYKEADVIFVDCETSPFKSGIHAHEEEHRKIEDNITKKEILYHYQIEPDNSDKKFKGVAKIGDTWEF